MKTLISIFCLLMSSTIAFPQNGIPGFWAHLPQEGDYFLYDGLFLTEDGYYYAEKVYSEAYQDLVLPEFSLGVYEVQNNELKLYDMKGDRYLTYQISILNQQQLQLTDPSDNEPYNYSYQGLAELNDEIKESLLSWENFRKMGGTWQSEESTLKAIPSLGIILILNNQNMDYFNWGQYSILGNELKITTIDRNEGLIYTGQIISFSQTDFTLVNEDGEEKFNYLGKLNLNENEKLMVQQYMKMNNRLAMTTIDMIDGVQDFIWVRETSNRY